MLQSRHSQFFLWFPVLLVSFTCSSVLFQELQLWLESLSLSSLHISPVFFLSFTLNLLCAGEAKWDYYLLFGEFFTPALADSFSLEFERQQVSSNLQYTSQYYGRSQQCNSLDGLHSSSYFQLLQSLDQFFGDCTKRTNYNWYNRHIHVPQCFQFSSKV